MTDSNLHTVACDAVANAGPNDSIAAALRRAVIDRAAGEPIVVLGVACAPVACEHGATWEGIGDDCAIDVTARADGRWDILLTTFYAAEHVQFRGRGETRDAAVRDLRAKRDELVRRLIGSEIGRALGAMHGGGR